MTVEQKVIIARQLEKLGVEVRLGSAVTDCNDDGVRLGEEASRAREQQGSLLSAKRSHAFSSADIDALFA